MSQCVVIGLTVYASRSGDLSQQLNAEKGSRRIGCGPAPRCYVATIGIEEVDSFCTEAVEAAMRVSPSAIKHHCEARNSAKLLEKPRSGKRPQCLRVTTR